MSYDIKNHIIHKFLLFKFWFSEYELILSDMLMHSNVPFPIIIIIHLIIIHSITRTICLLRLVNINGGATNHVLEQICLLENDVSHTSDITTTVILSYNK